MEKMLRLSKSVTDLFNDVLKDTADANLESVNFIILLSNIMGAVLPDGSATDLANYFLSKRINSVSIDSSLASMLMDYQASIEQIQDVTVDAQKNVDSTQNLTADAQNSKISEFIVSTKEIAAILAEESESDESIPSIVIYSYPDFFTDLVFIDSNNEELVVGVNKDVFRVYEKLVELYNKFDISEVEILHITVAMFMTSFKTFQKFFYLNGLSYQEANRFFSPERLSVIGTIPLDLMDFLETHNDKVDISKPCEILERDVEADNLLNILLKMNKKNAIIVGSAGVGKSALVEKLTYDIIAGNSPEEFKDFKVIYLDVNALIAGTSYRGQAEQRIQNLINFLESKDDIILFIDEVHTILGAGSCFEGEMDLANALKPLLARGDTIVIGATTENEYEKYFKKDAALARRFEPVIVNEPSYKKVYPMIKNKIKVLSDYHGVTITKNMVEYAIMIAGCFAFEKKNPDKTLDLLDRAMVVTKRSNMKQVRKKDILKNFDIFFKIWEMMSIDSKNEVTYHELGHYIVGKASGLLIDIDWIAVSIMPAENYLGVTVSEPNREKVPFKNINYFVDYIAFQLGGRVAENLVTKSFTQGACEDLQVATKTAFDVVTKFDLGFNSSRNHVFLNTDDYPMFSEKVTNAVNDDVKILVDKAFARAEEIINENMDILEALVPVLLKKRIMSETELDKVWKSVIKKRNK